MDKINKTETIKLAKVTDDVIENLDPEDDSVVLKKIPTINSSISKLFSQVLSDPNFADLQKEYSEVLEEISKEYIEVEGLNNIEVEDESSDEDDQEENTNSKNDTEKEPNTQPVQTQPQEQNNPTTNDKELKNQKQDNVEDVENEDLNQDYSNKPEQSLETQSDKKDLDINKPELEDEPINENPIEQPKVEELKEPKEPKKPKYFTVFNNDFENEMNQMIDSIPNQKEVKQILNSFFSNRKHFFPLLEGKISLFEIFVLIYFVQLIQDINVIKSKYKIDLIIDKDRANANMTQLWEPAAKNLSYSKNEQTQIIYFDNEKDALQTIKEIQTSSNQNDLVVMKVNEEKFKLIEDTYLPLTNINLISNPNFSLSKLENSVINIEILNKLLNTKIKKITSKNENKDKTLIKIIHYKEWTESKWIKYIESLIKINEKELLGFDLESPKNIYERFVKYKDIDITRLFVMSDPEIKTISNKMPSQESFIYDLVYYSWLRFLIKSQPENQIKEEFSYNMFSFICDTKLITEKSHLLFHQKLFTKDNLTKRINKEIKLEEEVPIPKSSLIVSKQEPEGFELQQLSLIFNSNKLNWLEYNFLINAISNLNKNKFIKIDGNKLFISEQLEKYLDSLKDKKFNSFVENVNSAFSSYFAKDAKKFIEKIQKISEKPF